MATNYRKKAFIRVDQAGRVIQGSLVLRNKKPSIGRWIEVASSLCCTTTTTVID